MDLELLVCLGGVLQLGVLIASALVPIVLDWRTQLGLLPRLFRQLVWIYGGYVVLMIIGLGSLSLLQADALTNGSTLSRSITAFITVFWSIRLALQLFVLDSGPYLTQRWLRIGDHGLTATFLYLTVVFGIVTIL